MTKPSSVARLTVFSSERSDITTAPSMPMKTHSVTSIVLFTWASTLPSGLWPARLELTLPQKSPPHMPAFIEMATTRMKTATGMNLPIVPMMLSTAAPLTPRSTSQFMSQNTIEASRTACQVFPPLKYGGKK